MDQDTFALLARIANALERMAPAAPTPFVPDQAQAFVWHADPDHLAPITNVSRVDIDLLKGIDHQKEQLLSNSLRFAKGLPANNALLWGARGSGKSSLVKAVHGHIRQNHSSPLILVEIQREDIPTLPRLLRLLKAADQHRFILFCDDLSFEGQDAAYKSLKGVLEGGIEGRPANVVFYATSNRRHLMSRDMIDNERSSAINPVKLSKKKSLCPIALGCGWAFIMWGRIFIWISSTVTPAALTCPLTATPCTPKPTNGL